MPAQHEQSHIQSLAQKNENDSPEAVRQVYDDWATSYDNDLQDLGYVAPQNAAAMLAKLMPERDGLVLDGGCGTGLIGPHLQAYGFRRLHGCDYSQDMLLEAKRTGRYDWLGVVDMTQPFPLDSDCYDAALCVGVLGPRLPARPMIPELIRVTRPGGLMLVVIREQWFAERLEATINAMLTTGRVQLATQSVHPYLTKDDVAGRFIALRKCPVAGL